jgi:hypothetical protein
MRVSWFPYLGLPSPTSGAFTENFDHTWSQRWTVFGGNWSARNDALSTVPASANGAKAVAMETAFTNFTYAADVSVEASGDAGLIFRVTKPDIGTDAYCGYYAGINAKTSELVLGYVNNSWHQITSAPMEFTPNKSYRLKVEASGSRLRVFLGASQRAILDVQDDHFSSGMIGVRNYCKDGDRSLSSFSTLVVNEIKKVD